MFSALLNNSIKLSITLTSFWLGTASYSIIHNELLKYKLLNDSITINSITISGIVGSMIGLYTYSLIDTTNYTPDKAFICNIKIITDYNRL